MGDYQSRAARLLNLGLNLRNSPDEVGEGQWTRLHNVRSTQEGQLQIGEGSVLDTSTGVVGQVHTLRRIGDSTKLIGIGAQIFRNGTVFATAGWSGNPIGTVPYRPTLSSTVWTYLGDSNKMRKVKSDGTDYKWGIDGPAAAASFNTSGAGNLDSSVAGGTVYDWRYTYYSTATGAESNPSPTASGIAAVNQKVDVSVDASADPQVDQIRLYRRGGTLVNWVLTVTSANAAGVITDNNADSTIAANEVMDLDRDVPFTSVDASGNVAYGVPMPYVWGPFLGKYIMACGDTNRPGFMYWTNAQRPDEAASSNNLEVTSPREPLQNGFIFSEHPFVWSKDNLYAIEFGSATSVTFTPRRTPCGRGLAAPWAFCVGPLIYFLGTDGIYSTDGQSPAQSLTEEFLRPLFRGISAGNLLPIDFTQTTKLRMAFFDNELHFYYQDSGGSSRQLIYNTLYNRWRSRKAPSTDLFIGYADENQSAATFYEGGTDGNVYRLDPTINTFAGSTYSVNGRTGSDDFEAPTTLKELGNIIIDADPQGNTITVTPYVNTEQTALPSFTLSGNGRQKFSRSLADVRAYNLAFDFEWGTNPFAGIIYQMDVMWRMEEEAIRHWEFITTHGLVGWQHVRDVYFTLISNEAVTFTLNIDGVDYTYSIPSTNGARLKRYVQLRPTKGKVFTYTLDCDSDFRLFGNECEVRVKPWLTSLGYQLMSPFQGPQVEA